MEFEWDNDKAETNSVKHGVTFEEATTVFDDFVGFDSYDEDHSDNEDRSILIGQS